MGVTGLWRLIDASGKPVPPESLEGKVLAIDISIWIHQVLQGYQDGRGNALPNAHLLGLFTRICKLLYFKIKPVFVFDGGVPLLKKTTIAARKKQKALALGKAEKLKNDLILNLMKHSLVKNVLSKKPPEEVQSSSSDTPNPLKTVNDMFKLPLAPPQELESFSDSTESDSDDLSPRKQSKWRGNIHTVDITSNDFKSLPPDVRYDILTDLKETRKQNSWGRLHEIPEESNRFSDYQMKRLLKRRKAQEYLEVAEQEMGGKNLTLDELEKLMAEQGVDTKSRDLAYRIASDDVTRVLYVRDPKAQAQKSSGLGADVSQPSCSRDSGSSSLDGELTVIPEETSSVLEDIGEYDLEDWDSDVEIIEQPKRFFGKVSKNPALTYMMENSELSQEQILALIQQSKASIKKAKAEKTRGAPGRGEVLEKKRKIESNFCESPGIKQEVESSGEVSRQDLSKEKAGIGVDEEKDNGSCESDDSGDFVEVQDVEISLLMPEKMEIVIQPGSGVDGDDLFADVFQGNHETQNFTLNPGNSSDGGQKSGDLQNSLNISSETSPPEKSFIKNHVPEISGEDEEIAILNHEKKEMNNLSKERNENNEKQVIDVDIAEEQGERSEEFIIKKIPSRPEDQKERIDEDLSAGLTNLERLEELGQSPIKRVEPLPELSPDKTTPPEKEKNPVSEDLPGEIPPKSPPAVDARERSPEAPETLKESPPKNPSERITSILTRLASEKFDLLAKSSKEEHLEDLKTQLETEVKELKQNIGKLDRQSTEVTEQMRADAQDLLGLFGIPYVVAPQEAEAQCAYLEAINLTDGSITDDSDIWLFGGKCVYRNFFNNAKSVMQYLAKDIEHHFKLTREQMIQLALLVGSDYTVGISGIGPVTAMEILASFPGQGDDILRGLRNFSVWVRGGRIVGPGRASLRSKLKNVAVDRGFPSQAVAQAYLFPTVDESRETFSWGKPNLVLLGDYTREKFGWTRAKFEETMGPVMKRLEAKSQRNIMAYFKVRSVPKAIEEGISKRVQKAVERMGKDPEEVGKPVRKREKGRGKQMDQAGGFCGTIGPDGVADVEGEEKVIDRKTDTKGGKCEEVIPQREKDKKNALDKKLKAIEVFRKSRKGPGMSKKNSRPRRTVRKEAKLSESSSDTE
uniref:ERCC5_0 protein n=1 Tax=Fopius arisanus TaxID=64838 RepID=A0A0C9QDH7_9HYME